MTEWMSKNANEGPNGNSNEFLRVDTNNFDGQDKCD